MMNELKSISQIAKDLGVTRQTVYNKLKAAALSAAVNEHIVKQGNYTLYDLQAQELIKQAICGNTANDDLTRCKAEFDRVSNDLTACKENFDKVSKELETKDNKILELSAAIDDLKAENESVKKELTECKRKVSNLTEFNNLHHKTIDRLEKENAKLNERLDKAETERTGFLNSISDLTIALKAAQALHGMDKQQAVIDLKKPAEQAAQDQTEPPRKTSLFSKLFRRK